MINKIYVGNISEKTTDSDLFDLFSPFGAIVSAKISSGVDEKKHGGYGYVTMNNDKEMNKAIIKLNNTTLKGNTIRVIEAHPIDKDFIFVSRRNKFRRR